MSVVGIVCLFVCCGCWRQRSIGGGFVVVAAAPSLLRCVFCTRRFLDVHGAISFCCSG